MPRFTFSFLLSLALFAAVAPSCASSSGRYLSRSPLFDRVVDLSYPIEKIAEVGESTEGPAWIDADRLIFSGKGRIWMWSRDGTRLWREGLDNNNGNLALPDGRIFSCERGRNPRLLEWDGETPKTAAAVASSARLLQPNDLTLGPDGAIWFTDPDFSSVRSGDPSTAPATSRVLRWMPGDPPDAARVMASDFRLPNGLCFSPDGLFLYVGDSGIGTIRRHRFRDGELRGSDVFASGLPRWLPDGIKCTAEGYLLVASGGDPDEGVRVYTPQGEWIGTVVVPGFTTNLAIAPDGLTVAVTSGDGVFRFRLAR